MYLDKKELVLSSVIFLLMVFGCKSNKASIKTQTKPNVVYILADDLGYGDVNALNSDSKIPTPNIDRLAYEGMSFTDAHSNSSACTPTRYGVITGQYAENKT